MNITIASLCTKATNAGKTTLAYASTFNTKERLVLNACSATALITLAAGVAPAVLIVTGVVVAARIKRGMED